MKANYKIVTMAFMAVLVFSGLASASASAHQWKVNGVEASGQEVSISGGTSTLQTGAKVITCKKASGHGTVKAGGLGEAAELKFTECTTSQGGCSPYTVGQPAGTVVGTAIQTLLTEREPTGEGKKKLADELKGGHPGGEWLTLKYAGTCSEFSEGKLTGETAGTVESLVNGNIKLAWSNPELKGNTLAIFGLAAKFTMSLENHLVASGTLTAS